MRYAVPARSAPRPAYLTRGCLASPQKPFCREPYVRDCRSAVGTLHSQCANPRPNAAVSGRGMTVFGELVQSGYSTNVGGHAVAQVVLCVRTEALVLFQE